MYFQELFIWLAREHHLSQLIDAPGGSFSLLEPLWASMVALGGSWRKYMKTIVLCSKTSTFHSPRLFWTFPKKYILDHSKFLKTIALSTSESKAREPSNQASWGWFWWLLEPRLESHCTILHQKSILLSDHCSLGHLFVDPPPTTHRASGGPTKKMCLRKSVFIIICPPPHITHFIVTCRVGTPRSVVS